jgi:hypothetical protein
MNDFGRGELAFWGKMGLQEAIVRATPQQLLYVDMAPSPDSLDGYTASNLDLVSPVGVNNFWDGTF